MHIGLFLDFGGFDRLDVAYDGSNRSLYNVLVSQEVSGGMQASAQVWYTFHLLCVSLQQQQQS